MEKIKDPLAVYKNLTKKRAHSLPKKCFLALT